MSDVKYICCNGTLILFPCHLDHAATADKMYFNKADITGAGFVAVGMDGRFACYGESISLDIKSDAVMDTMRVNRMFGNDI